MANKRVPNINEQLYNKEVRRLRQFIRRAEKRGYVFPETIIPKRPKTVTAKSVQRLKRLTSSELYKKATYTAPDTGITVSGTEGRQIEREAAITKSLRSRAIPYTPTPSQSTQAIKQYNAELRRINRALSRLQKRGYTIQIPFLPEKPEQITVQDIEELQAITTPSLYQYLTYRDLATGQILTGEQGRQLERQRASRKGVETRQRKAQESTQPIQPPQYPVASYEILNNVYQSISQWVPASNYTDYFKQVKERDKNVLQNMLNGAVRQEGEDVIAARLESYATEVIAIVEEVLYGSSEDKIQGDFSRFSNILYGRSLTNDESKQLAESLENLEDNEPPV